uniref:Uncharacterized protein n=1 Tax=Cereibacter sphaeroides (strain ATCC 17025 / ATH 2.4.3) TaxID=349102 RepID=A4WTB2_CERS5
MSGVDHKSFTVEAMADAARTILTAYDAHMSGGQSVPDEVANRIAMGAAFGAAAYEAGMSGGQDVHAMLRATLLGIIDPADQALDYLRAGNQPAEPRIVYEPYPGAFDHILGPAAPRTLPEFITDEMEG